MNEFRSRKSVRQPFGRSTSAQGGFGPATYEDSDQVDLRRVVWTVWNRRLFLLFWTLLGAALFYLLTATLPPRYAARATIMLDPREQQVIATQDQVVSDLKLNNAILESEVAVLKSNLLLQRVVTTIGIDHFNGVDPATADHGPLGRLLDSTMTSLRDLVSSTFPADAPSPRSDTGAALVTPEQMRLNRVLRALREGLTVARLGDSYVIDITVETSNPQLSAQTANALAGAYIEAQVEARRRVAESATSWLSAQVDKRRAELEKAETRAEALKRAQLSSVGASPDVVTQQLSELNQQLALTRSERATQEARLDKIRALKAEGGSMAVALSQDSGYLATLRTERDRIEGEDARLAAAMGPDNPARQGLRANLDRIDAALVKEAENIAQDYRNEIDVQRVRETSLARDVAQLESKLSEISGSSLELRQAEREVEAARSSYEELLARLGETRAQVEIQRAEAQILSAAQIPSGPSAPRPLLFASFGASLALTASLIAVLLKDLAAPGFLQGSQIETATGLRLLTALPRSRLSARRSVLRALDEPGYSLLGERVRQLRTVLLATNAKRSQSILLLSSIPDEGKTTVALALAQVFARNRTPTIVVDLDTRRAGLMREMGISTGTDLADHLAGTANLQEAIIRPDGLDFDVLGTIGQKPAQADQVPLGRIAELIDELKRKYSAVIIDAPPVLAVSDGLAIAQTADQVIYLVRWRSTPRRAVTDGLAALENVGVRPAGLVMTMVAKDSDPDGYARNYSYD